MSGQPHSRPRRRRPVPIAVITAVATSALVMPMLAPAAEAAQRPPGPGLTAPSAPSTAKLRAEGTTHGIDRYGTLPSPPRPPSGRPVQRTDARRSAPAATASPLRAAAVAPPSAARTFGPTGPARTLVLYDSTGPYGWLGELYALAGGSLASHFGEVTAEPVTSYVAGQVEDHTATMYFGSTYNEAIPAAFLSDVQTTTRPVLWSGFNVWQLSGQTGSAAWTAFQARYGWDASTSYLDSTDKLLTVGYKGRTLTRNALNTGGVLSPHITTPAAVTVLAQANCTDAAGTPVNCAGIAQTTGTSLPWAIRSSNLTYVGEIPFSYLSERDRYLAFADLLFPALAPSTTAVKSAAVRLEDISPVSDPAVLRQFADYLSGQGVPFQVGVIPQYTDSKGINSDGVPRTVTLAQAPDVVAALQYVESKGGTLVQHGWTHQYSNVENPYNGVSGDDFEFFRSRCSSTQNAPYEFGSCRDSSWVILEGPVPEDSPAWAAGRVTAGRDLFTGAGLTAPTIFETPHYTASAAAYQGIQQVYPTRYEREVFYGGLLNPANSSGKVFGQFFPYSVTDVYGAKVLPENLGNFEPVQYNNNPPRTAAEIVANAAANQVVTQSTASLFFHADDYPLSELQAIVSGIKELGYTFVTAGSLP